MAAPSRRNWSGIGFATGGGTTGNMGSITGTDYPQVGDYIMAVAAYDNASGTSPYVSNFSVSGAGAVGAWSILQLDAPVATASGSVMVAVGFAKVTTAFTSTSRVNYTLDASSPGVRTVGATAVSGATSAAFGGSSQASGTQLGGGTSDTITLVGAGTESNAAPGVAGTGTVICSSGSTGGGAAANCWSALIAATSAGSTIGATFSDGGEVAVVFDGAAPATPVSTSDSSTVSLTESVSIATTDAKATSDSATVSLSESVQLLKAINVSDAMDVSLTESATTSSSGGGASYRMYESATPPTAAATDNAAVTLGVEFYVTQDCNLTEIRWWQPTTGADRNTSQRQGGVWTASNQFLVASTPFATPSGDGWQTLTFATPVALTANTRYRVGVYHPNAGYAATGAYFSGGADETNGPLVIPKAANVPAGQGGYNYNAGLAYPGSSFNDTNYWLDVTVATSGGSGPTSTPVSDTATVSLTESATVTGTAGRSETTTVSLSEAISIVSTVGVTDTLTASLGEAVSAGIFVTKSVADAVTVSLAETATTQIVTTLSVADAMTVSVAESRAIAASSALTDALTVSLSEARGIAVSSSVSDAITVSLTESRALLVAFSVSDAVAASLSESAAPLVRIAPTDTATISFTESVMARDPASGAMVKVWNGTTWVTGTLRVWDGAQWAEVILQRWTGSAWVNV